MAFIGLKTPHETARLLAEVEITGPGVSFGDLAKKEDPSHFHITVIYLGSKVPIETLTKAIPAIFEVTAQTKPFTVSTDQISTFPHGEDGTPIICPIESDELHAFRDALCAALDAAGVDYPKTYPVYQPHLTLAYGDKPETSGNIQIDFPELEWGAHEVVLWGGDSGDNKLVVTFPFSMGQTKQAMDRAMVRLATYRSRL